MRRVWHEIYAFLRLVAESDRRVVPALVFGTLAGAFSPFLGLALSARILNQAIAGDYAGCAGSAFLLIAGQLALGVIEKLCFQNMELLKAVSAEQARERMAAKAYELEYEQLERQETIDTIRRVRNSELSSGGIEDQLNDVWLMFTAAFSLLCSMVFLVQLFLRVDVRSGSFFTSYASTAVLAAVYAAALALSGKQAKIVERVYDEMLEKNDRNNSVVNYYASLRNERYAKDLRVFQMQEMLGNKLMTTIEKTIGLYLDSGKKAGRALGVQSFAAQIAAGISYVFICAKAVYGVIGVGDILLYAGAINRVMQDAVSLVSTAYNFLYKASYLGTIAEFIHRPSMSYDGTLPIEKRDDARYEFEFHDVSFSYPQSEEKVLSHVSLKFEIGEKLALVGKNGAGKTTLIKLLCRLYEPTEGYITLNGIDIRKYNYREYTNAFSVVFQDFHIFSLPLGENVASGSSVDEDAVWKALEEVSLKERVEEMEDGLASRLYNNNGAGIDISGGEAQRLAIARALYKDAPFVILDEPTAALDPIAEAEIYENFNGMIAHKTAIYISHRMSSCKFCDRIVVLDGGQIAEAGTHEQLLTAQGIYAELYGTQAQYYA